MRKFLIGFVVVMVTMQTTTWAGILAGWEISGVDLDDDTATGIDNSPADSNYTYTASTLGVNVSDAKLTLSTAVNRTTSNNQYGFKISDGNETTSLDSAIGAGHYFQFTLEAAPRYRLNLDSLEMNAQSSGTGADGAAIMTNIDGFTDGNEIASVTGKSDTTGGFDTDDSGFGAPIDLAGARYQGITSITFRFYGWGTTGSTGTTYIRPLSGDDLSISGTVYAIPEPTAFSLLFFMLAILGGSRRFAVGPFLS
jgi:hypothetical protein